VRAAAAMALAHVTDVITIVVLVAAHITRNILQQHLAVLTLYVPQACIDVEVENVVHVRDALAMLMVIT
jgi:hypothetical protein